MDVMAWMHWFRNYVRQSANIVPPADQHCPILAICSLQTDTSALEVVARTEGWQIGFAPTLDEAIERLTRSKSPIVIFDKDLPFCDWRQVLLELTRVAPASVILVASSNDADSLWEEVVELGGYEILQKPFERGKVAQTFGFAWRYWKLTNKCVER
jgi:DNA-binding NtrC family response regulator